MEHNSAKHFALQLGSLISLYVSIGALINLLFGAITLLHPDPLQSMWESQSAQESIRISIALLIVFFPAYVVLTRTVNVMRRTGTAYISFTKWLIYLSLLVGGIVILGDLVAIIYNFLNGELTTRFILKALSMLIVVGAAFIYYLYDAREYWMSHERQSKQYGIGASVLIVIALVFGYMQIANPMEVRDRIADDKQIQDLRNIQTTVSNYFVSNRTLPQTLEEATRGDAIAEAPEGREQYSYRMTSTSTFELCATFAYPSTEEYVQPYSKPYLGDARGIINSEEWGHKEGHTCFTRIIQ